MKKTLHALREALWRRFRQKPGNTPISLARRAPTTLLKEIQMKKQRPSYPDVSDQLLELVKTGATSRMKICLMLSITLVTLSKRLKDHHYKPWMIDRLRSKLKIIVPKDDNET